MNQIKVKLRMDEFNRVYRRKLELTKRGLAETANKTAFFVARRACRETPRADRSEILAEIGVVGKREIAQKISYTKKGKIRKGGLVKENVYAGEDESGLNSNAERIIRARIQRGLPLPRRVEKITGGKQPGVTEIRAAVKAFVGSALSAVGDVASGWLPAIKTLANLMKEGAGQAAARGVKQFGKDQGRAEPARPGISPIAVIENSVQNRLARDPNFLVEKGLPALQAAIDYEAGKILEYVKRKEYEDAKRLGIKVFG